MTASFPHIGLGAMDLGTPDEAAAVTAALELGRRYVDTVQIYGDEAVVGDALTAADVPCEDVTFATRVWADDLAPADVYRMTRESLGKLGTDSVDPLYVHRPIDTYGPEATLATFDELVDDGPARGVGVSNFTTTESDEALDLLDTPLIAHQTKYHPLFQRSELLDRAEERGCDVIVYSPLSGGRVRDIDEVVTVAEKHGAMPEVMSLAWLAARGLYPIPKVSSGRHLRTNLDAVSLELDAANMTAINGIKSRVELFPE